MRSIYLASILIISMPLQAALVGNGTYTSDTASGLDWLDLDLTFEMSMGDALTANSGWRLASEAEVSVLFEQVFPNFVETNGNCYPGPSCGTSDTNYGAPTEIIGDMQYFHSLFGYREFSGILQARGMYFDAINPTVVRSMGAQGGSASAKVYGMDFTWAVDDSYSAVGIGSYLVRSSVVPIPAAVWLFGSALACLGWMKRKQTF